MPSSHPLKENRIMSRKYVERKEFTMREKFIKTLEAFFEQSKDYVIEVYIKNVDEDFYIGKTYIPSTREWKSNREKGFKVLWNGNCSSIAFLYDKVNAYCEEIDKNYNQNIYVILTNRICINFSCRI